MKWFMIFAGALLLIIAAGLHIQRDIAQTRERVFGLCLTTRTGEPWPRVKARAEERGLFFEKSSPAAQVPEEFLTTAEAMGERYGCTVRVRDDRVVDTRTGQLPSRQASSE